MIKRVLEDIKIAYNNKAYFSALALTLTIPDICGKIQYKNDSNYKTKELASTFMLQLNGGNHEE